MAKIVSNFVISEFCLKKMITFILIIYFSYMKRLIQLNIPYYIINGYCFTICLLYYIFNFR